MDSFEELYRKHVGAVFRFSMRLVGDRSVAEDLTSEAFLELLRHVDTIDAGRLPAWLFTVARNRAMDYWRHRAVEQRNQPDPPEPVATVPGSERWLFENKALKPIHRLCLVLRYVHGMNRAEISARTGLSEMQIKGHLQYARQLLRKELGSASG